MSLSTYNKKRNFRQTPEPGGKASKKSMIRTFVIQRHKASRLHYDFRLEADGVLKSWAIPRGPSLNPTDKRLSVMVEDHPLAYGKFKGKIPEGNYGAGIVEIWDNGTYVPEEMEKVSDRAIVRAIESGMLKFSLKGKKLKGSFALVRIDGKNWLLIKHRDRYATDSEYNSEAYTLKTSPINRALKSEDKGKGSNRSASSQKNSALKDFVAKKSAPKKSAPKKSVANKSTPKKSAPKKSAANKSTPKKSAAKKSAPKKSAAKKSAPKKSAANKSTRKKSAAKKSAPNKSAAKSL